MLNPAPEVCHRVVLFLPLGFRVSRSTRPIAPPTNAASKRASLRRSTTVSSPTMLPLTGLLTFPDTRPYYCPGKK